MCLLAPSNAFISMLPGGSTAELLMGLAPDLPQRPLLPRAHLLAGGLAEHDVFHSMPLREAYHHRNDSRIFYLQWPAHDTR